MLEEVFILLITIFSISFVALFWENVILLTILLLIIAIFTLIYFHKKNDLITFFVGSMSGAFAESVCIYFEAWVYNNPTFLIPLWLPILWGIAALVIRRFTLKIEKKKR
jgi:hypothetical protein